MRIREIALALPLVIGFAACKTSSTQGSRTASKEQGSTGASAQAGTGAASESGRVSGSTTEPSTSGSSRSPGGTVPTDTSRGSASSQQGSSYGSMGGASATGDLKAHSDDQVVTGKISAVSAQSMTVTTDAGEQRTLHLAPQTSLTVNGREDAQASDLAEGLPVRASYNTVGDQDVAVDVRAGTGVSDPSTTPHDSLDPNMDRKQ